MSQKKAVDLDGFFSRAKDLFEQLPDSVKLGARGVGCDVIAEPVPEYIEAPCETVHRGQNNSFIVLGRDRPASRLSGYGGRGDTQSSMIDICVGRMAHKPKSESDDGEVVHADPNFKIDSARIYISQKTDVDDNFGLCDGEVGKSKSKSAIALKADGLRLIAREGIKLITRTDENNSQGGPIKSVVGIDLIAGNDDSDMQPFAKGDNLVSCLQRIIHHMDKLNGIVDSLLMTQMQFNGALTSHFHFSPFYGIPTSPSPPVISSGISTMINHLSQTKMSLVTHKANLQTCATTYLTSGGGKYINSRYNKVN
jgi:hypothetical protein